MEELELSFNYLNYQDNVEHNIDRGYDDSFWLSDCCRYPAKNFDVWWDYDKEIAIGCHYGICAKCGDEQEFFLRDLKFLFGMEDNLGFNEWKPAFEKMLKTIK